MFVEKPSQDSDVISRTQSNAFDQRLERLSQSFRTLQDNFLSELTPSPDRQGLHANATSINEIDAQGFTYDDVVETKKIANVCKRCGEQQFESICSCERSFLFKKDLSRNEAPIPDSCNSSLLSEYGSFRSKIPKSLPVRTSSSVSTNTYLRSTDTEKESFHSHDNTQSQKVPEPPPTVLAMHEYNEKLLQEALKASGISLTRSDTLHELVTGKLAENMSWPFCPDRSDSSGELSHGRIPKCTSSSHLTTRPCIFFGSEITDLHVLIRNTLKLFFPNPHRSDDETHVLAEEVIEAIEGNLGTLPQDYREIMESQHAVLDRTKWKQWAKQSYEARFDLITDGVHFVLTVLISYFGNKSTFVSRMYPGERVVAKQAPAVADIHSVSPDTSMCQKDASVHEKRKAKALILPRQIREGPNTLQSTHDVCHTSNTTVLGSPSFMEWNSSHSTPQRTRAVWKRSLIIAQESIHPGGVSEFLLDPFHVPQHNNNKSFTREGRENDYHCELEDVSPINPAVK